MRFSCLTLDDFFCIKHSQFLVEHFWCFGQRKRDFLAFGIDLGIDFAFGIDFALGIDFAFGIDLAQEMQDSFVLVQERRDFLDLGIDLGWGIEDFLAFGIDLVWGKRDYLLGRK